MVADTDPDGRTDRSGTYSSQIKIGISFSSEQSVAGN
jgi:hypothetical protein